MSNDVREILSDDALAALRGAYDRNIMVHVATTLTMSNYTDSKDWFDFLAARHYRADDARPGMNDQDRERCLIAVFAAGRRAPFALASHVYWGLMEGLSVDDVADIILLSSAYAGVDVFADGMFTLGETLRVLAALANKGGDSLSPVAALTTLVNGFRVRPSANLA